MSTGPPPADSARAHAALVARLDAALPQTQCTRCGYPHCRGYAEALARGGADIDRCPPGNDVTIRALAQILGVAPKPLDPERGAPGSRRRAVIDETRCIGCRKCADACPVDAIVGAHKWMHTVVASQCSGCELCLPPCPVDCIALVPAPPPAPGATWPDYTDIEVRQWRIRAGARLARAARPAKAGPVRRPRRSGADGGLRQTPPRDQIRAEIDAAVARAAARRGARNFHGD